MSFILIGILLLALFLIIGSGTVLALKNPAAVYCEELGYEYYIIETYKGDRGVCKLPDGSLVNAWWLLTGKVTLNSSYCEKMGYEIKRIEDYEFCSSIYNSQCSACVLENGTEVEVTKLMGLSFVESVCGDGACGLLENFSVCPQDCPSGGIDDYCDGVKDGVCDPDCVEEAKHDPDCPQVPALTLIGLSALFGLLAIAGILALRKK